MSDAIPLEEGLARTWVGRLPSNINPLRVVNSDSLTAQYNKVSQKVLHIYLCIPKDPTT